MKKQSSLKKEKQPKMKLHKKWKQRKAVKFISRSNETMSEKRLLEICKEIKFENEDDKLIFEDSINYIDGILLTDVLLFNINILFAKSVYFKDTESTCKLNILQHQIYYEDFDYVIIVRELKKIINNLKKYK